MILDRYIFKELLKSQLVVLLVLIAIFAAQSLIRLITEAASGDLPAVLITQFLIYSLPDFLSLLLPLTLYVSLIITLGRICSDSEMVVMRAVGFSPKRIMTIALFLGVISMILSGYISLFLSPKAALASQELQLQAAKSPEFLPIDSGRFVSFGKYNIYVEKVDGQGNNNKEVSNVFVIDSEVPNELSLTVARQGHMIVDEEGIRWLVLNDGRRYENPSDGTFRVGSFSEFKAPLSGNVNDASPKLNKLNTRSSYDLLTSSDLNAQIEFQWRVSPIFAVLVMCMVAVPLSMVNPRQGRFTRLMPAIIIYVAYYLFLMSLRNLVRTGSVPLYPGLYLVPLCFFLLVAIPLNLPKTYLKHIKSKATAKTNQPAIAGQVATGYEQNTSDNVNITDNANIADAVDGAKDNIKQDQNEANQGQKLSEQKLVSTAKSAFKKAAQQEEALAKRAEESEDSNGSKGTKGSKEASGSEETNGADASSQSLIDRSSHDDK